MAGAAVSVVPPQANPKPLLPVRQTTSRILAMRPARQQFRASRRRCLGLSAFDMGRERRNGNGRVPGLTGHGHGHTQYPSADARRSTQASANSPRQPTESGRRPFGAHTRPTYMAIVLRSHLHSWHGSAPISRRGYEPLFLKLTRRLNEISR